MRLKVRVPEVLSHNEIEEILKSALRILEETPLTADGTEEFNEAMVDFGCRLDGKKFFFPKGVIDYLMDRIASERQPVDPEAPIEDEIKPHVSGQGLKAVDVRDGKIRECTTADLAQLGWFLDALEQDIGWCNPTFLPCDAPLATREVHAFATICNNHSKPTRVSPYSLHAVKTMFEILKVCLGSEQAAREQGGVVMHKMWINTPFMMCRESIEAGMFSRNLLGHKVALTMMPVSGAATPVTSPGCLSLVTAEVLVANIISLALDDYLLGYCSSPLTMDLRVGAHTEADPYTDLLRVGANQMRLRLFGGKPWLSAFAPRTSAKVPGVQSVMEKTMGAMWHVMCGGRGFNSVGTLASGDVASLVQLLLDLELTGYLNRLVRGLECQGEDKLAEQVNIETIPDGARFMESEHTLMHFRGEQWYPMFMDRRFVNAWLEKPVTMLERARLEALRIMESAENRSPLSDAQKKEINAIVRQADSLAATA
jgi:trimethylamine:corrinoid methyltransferase-like protein